MNTKNENKPEEKVVNLFEDMTPHKHNEKSYDLMISEQESKEKELIKDKNKQSN